MKLCPCSITDIHSVSPYTAGSEIYAQFFQFHSLRNRVNTYLNLLHKPLATPVLEVSPNREVMEVMRPFELLRRFSQFLQCLFVHPPRLLSKHVFFARGCFGRRDGGPERVLREVRGCIRGGRGSVGAGLGSEGASEVASRFWRNEEVGREEVCIFSAIAGPVAKFDIIHVSTIL